MAPKKLPHSRGRPCVCQDLLSLQAGELGGPPACPVTREGGASRGRFQGCWSRGSAGGGARRAKGGAGRREEQAAAAATAAAAARPGRAAPSAHREREVLAAQRSHVSVRAVSGDRSPGGGRARRFRCFSHRRRPVDLGSAALSLLAWFLGPLRAVLSSPPPGREGHSFAPQKPPPSGLQRQTLPPCLPRQGPGGWSPGDLGWIRP